MSDRMTPIPFGVMMDWILRDMKRGDGIFGVRRPRLARGGTLDFLGEKMEAPVGPAAGPHTQLAQNLTAAYAGGARFFELKTVQTLDGPDLPVSKPCIDARDECYNVEWSTELRVPEAMGEYIKGWYALKLISKEFSLGSPDGFIFNMSVGYDLEGISSPKIDSFIEGLRDASETDAWRECRSWTLENLAKFKNVDADYVEAVSSKVCGSITLSTLHGCPPQEIERIASYLLAEKGLHTFIKCNPTLLGYDYCRMKLDELGYGYIAFDDHHFKEDLQYSEAVPMISRLMAKAEAKGLEFGVKLTNTFPVDNPKDVMAGDEMYMSGRALFPLTLEAARRLTIDFNGGLRISWSGGADAENLTELCAAGIWPVTLATTLLKPGGYQRLSQLADECDGAAAPFTRVDPEALGRIGVEAALSPKYRKPAKSAPSRKLDRPLPMTDCFVAPCGEGCPINQNVPEYMRLAGDGRFAEALSVILDKNPLPFITGTICGHKCAAKCTRNFYEEPVAIRAVKLLCAEKGLDAALSALPKPDRASSAKAAIIGGGPAGLAAAWFLGRNGINASVFEKSSEFGGVVRRIIPDFRISGEAIDNDMKIVSAYGAEFVHNALCESIEELKGRGYKYVIIATGAWKQGALELRGGEASEVFDFLGRFKRGEKMDLGENVIIIGGGNTAMDAARAAKRVPGVRNVAVVYRRTKGYMPAELEELELAQADDILFRELLSPISFSNGVLTCAKMELGAPDGSGRRRPVDTGERTEIPADTVIAAVGEEVESSLFTANGIKIDGRGHAICADDLSTNAAGVYVAGDAKGGPASVVEAIADARRAADAIARSEGLVPYGTKAENCGSEAEASARKGVVRRTGAVQEEPSRCLECSTVCENCADVCPNRANLIIRDAEGRPQIIHLDPLCNECGNCETFCPWAGAPYKDKFTYFKDACDFSDSKNTGYAPASDGTYLVRCRGSELKGDLEELAKKLPEEITSLIAAAEAQLPIRGMK